MFKVILKSFGAILIAIAALFVTSFVVNYLREVFDSSYLANSQVEPLNILGLMFVILAVKLPGLVMDFRPDKADLQNRLLIITIVISLFVILNLFAGELFRVFLNRVVPALSETLYHQVGVWESLFLILIFNLVKDQFD